MSENDLPNTRVKVPEPKRAKQVEAGGAMPPSPAEDEGDLSSRAIPLEATGAVQRWFRRHRVEVAIFVAVVALLTIGAIFVMRDPGPSNQRDVVTIGPSPGQSLDPYIAVRKRALEDAPASADRYAVVSFDKRLTAAELAQLSIEPGLKVEGLILGVNSQEVQTVPPTPSTDAAIQSWTAGQRARYEQQLAGADDQLAASPSPSAVADWFSGQKQRANQALDRLNSGAVIEGVVVRGPAREMSALQQRQGVVLVDIAPEGKRLDELIPVVVGVSN